MVCLHVGETHMEVRRQLSGAGSLHFYVGSWDPTQATRLAQQVPLPAALVSFCQSDTNVDISEERESRLRNCPHQIGL